MNTSTNLKLKVSPNRSTNQKQACHSFATLLRRPKDATRTLWSMAIWTSSHTEPDGSIDLAQPSQRSKAIFCTEEVPLMMAMHHFLACWLSKHARSKEFHSQECAWFLKPRKSQGVPTSLLSSKLLKSPSVNQMLASAWTLVLLTMNNSGSPVP